MHISVEESVALYYENRSDDTVKYLVDKGIMDKKEDFKFTARELYFYEQGCYFKSILYLLKHSIDILEEKK